MLPTFLIIGPPKCGTTALHAALDRHPQIYMSAVKEPYFFAFDGVPPRFAGPGHDYFQHHAVLDWEKYVGLFAAARDERALGEASSIYLTNWQTERTAENIRRRLPNVRIVAVLRQPAERAYSGFTFCRALGIEPLTDFRQALDAEDRRAAADWRPGFLYRRNGLYARNLTPYFDRFPQAQIQIYLYDDLRDRPQALLADLCQFLGVDPLLMPAEIQHRNVTLWTHSRWLQSLLRQDWRVKTLLPRRLRQTIGMRLRAWNRFKPPPLAPAVRDALTERYRDEIVRLQDLIGRDLGHWLTPSRSSGDLGHPRASAAGTDHAGAGERSKLC